MALFNFGNKKKFEELKKCMEEENYDVAVIVADQIPIHKVKNISEMNMLGKAYKKHEDFFLAKEFFERSYAQRISRTVLVDLMDCCLELKDLESTERYFNEYQKLAPEDKITQYMYRYEIEKRKGRERKLLIMILEELKVLEYVEKYAYELALQYHKVGRKQDCINECNDIISWFGTGDSVERARILLAYYRGEISLEEVESEGAYFPKKSLIQELKEKEQVEENIWLAKKAEQLREEVNKIEKVANYRDEVKKAKEVARAREEAKLAEEVKRMQEEIKKEKKEEENERKTEIKKVKDVVKIREEVKKREEIRREEEIKRAREELKRAEEAVSKARKEAKEIEEVIKMQEEVSCSEIVEEKIAPVEEVNEVVEVKENTTDVSLEEKIDFVENSLEDSISESFFELEKKEIEISKEQYKELVDLLERKQISLSEVLKSFGRIDNVKQQVLHSMDISLKTKDNSFFVVMGEEKSGKTTLELNMIKLLFELGLICYDRTAIIDAIQLNQVAIKDYENQLKNCNMIIEHAGSITEQKMEELVDFFRQNKNETCLFLEDSNVKMGELLTSQKEWTTLFNNQILLQEYTTDELMGFAYDYIKKEDYSINSMAASVLRRKIDEIVKFHGKESSLSYVMQLVKEILARAEQRVSNILLGMVSEGKIQIGEYLIVLLEDIVQ